MCLESISGCPFASFPTIPLAPNGPLVLAWGDPPDQKTRPLFSWVLLIWKLGVIATHPVSGCPSHIWPVVMY